MKRLCSIIIAICFVHIQAEFKQKIPLLIDPSLKEQSQKRLISWSETGDMGKPYSSVLGQKNVKNATSANSAMKTIATSGRYYLVEDVHMMPINTGVTCFKITASNVVFDMRGYSLTGATETASGAIGIEIADNVSHVEICNGTINSINGYGIKTGTGGSNINIKNIVVDTCTAENIYLQATDSYLENVRSLHSSGSYGSATGAIGLYANGTHRLLCKNSFFNANSGASNLSAGVFLLNSNDCKFENCSAIGNTTTGVSSANAYGFYVNNSGYLALVDCSIGHSSTSNGDVYGFYAVNASGMDLLNCNAKGNMGTAGKTYGFCFSSGCDGSLVRNCDVQENSGDSHAYGFANEGSNYMFFNECTARHQSSTALVTTTTTAGFYSAGGRGNTFRNCAADGNTASDVVSSVAAGFYLTNGEKYSNIIECKAKSNDGQSGTAYGIWLDSARRCTIKKNELFVNTGSTNGYGVKDTETSSVSVFLENFAYGNGTSTGLVVNNYDVALSPSDDTHHFPVQSAFLEDFRPIKDQVVYQNIELIERADTDAL